MREPGALPFPEHAPMPRFFVILAAILVAGCGQVGPLYLPDSPPPKNSPDSESDPQPPLQRTSPQP